MSTRTSKRSFCIVVSSSPETADGLHTYFSNSGLLTRTSCELRGVGELCANASSLVLFPDGFNTRDVIATIHSLRKEHPRLQLLLVTATPQRLRAACEPDNRSLVPVVLAKPAFGWNLLDAVRSHVSLEP